MAIKLPNKGNHPVVEGDFLTKYYHLPIINNFFIARLNSAFSLIKKKRFKNLLEIGCGSGVFMLQLKQICDNIYGLDISSDIEKVKKMLEREDCKVQLTRASVTDLPYRNESFDCVVSMSTLEHIQQLEKAILEIKRVLKNGGLAVLGFPIANKFTDYLFSLMRAEKEHKKEFRKIHPNTHRDILKALTKLFDSGLEIRNLPSYLPLDWALYCYCSCLKHE